MLNNQLPPLTPEIISKLGLAVEAGCDEATQREAFGDATVDWLNAAFQHPDMIALVEKNKAEIAPILAKREAEHQARLAEAAANPPEWTMVKEMFSGFRASGGSLGEGELGISFTPPHESTTKLNRIFGSKSNQAKHDWFEPLLGFVKLETDGVTLTKITILDEKPK